MFTFGMHILLVIQIIITVSAIECNQTQYVMDGKCIECGIGCGTCENEIGCTTCVEKYYLLKNKCLKCDSHCTSTCENEYGCRSCMETYTEKNGKCIAPPCPFCSEANCNGTYCVGCIHDYYVNKGKCVLCDKNCNECGIDGCLKCKHGYSVYNSRCKINTLSDRDIVFISVGSLLALIMCICFITMSISFVKKTINKYVPLKTEIN